MSKKLVSICIPVFNEVGNIESLLVELKKVTMKLKNYKFEFVFSDNNSTDGTWQKIVELKQTNKHIRAIRFSRNLGYQKSILQNYFHADGDALIQFDADLQDPLYMIEMFLLEWEKGYKIVHGVREKRNGSTVDGALRKLGYRFLTWASDGVLHSDVGDFRLIDRSVVNILRQRNYSNPYLRGIISTLGLKESRVNYEREIRKVGNSKINAIMVLKLGVIGLLSFSTKPIKIFIPIAIFFTFISFLGVFWIIYLNIFESNLPRGFSVTQIFLFVSIGLNALFAAIAGDYLHRIYQALHPTIEGHIIENL
jgi:dolichol-phosphate mannosyltransferase